MKRCKQNPNIRFYPYECFEQLLCDSDFIKGITGLVNLNVFDYISSEEYFEKMLEKSTKGSIIEYIHGKPLKEEYLDKKNFSVIFSGKVASHIKSYIENRGNIYGNV